VDYQYNHVPTLLDTSLRHKFCHSLPEAEHWAVREAADTGGVLLRIRSFRLEPNNLVVTGMIATAAIVIGYSSDCSARVRPRSIGTMRLVQNSLLHPRPDHEFGYLVLQTPVTASEQLPESEDGEISWVALSIPRAFHTLDPSFIGAACCARCNRPITLQRLMAVPNTRVCINCQQKKEKE
jgi:hypothetical protein